jgi:hypothetical protein
MGKIQMSKLKCQMNMKTNPNVKARITNLEFGFWHLTFSLTLELGAASGAPTFHIPHSAFPTMV